MTDVPAAELPVADPTESERQVWAAFARGEQVDLRAQDAEADDPRRAETWDASRRVRAEVVAALWLGAVKPAAGRVGGLRLAGALVEGSVDVRGGVINCPVEMTGCCFTGAVVLAEARTRTVDLSGSVLQTMDAAAAEFGGHLILQQCQTAAVSLGVAHVSGQLNLIGAKLASPGGTALQADGITVDGGMFGQDGFQAEGEVRLVGAHISGPLVLSGAKLANHAGIALSADRITVDGGMFCGEKFQAEGEVRLPGAHISGQLDLIGAKLANHPGIALNAERITVDGAMSGEGFQAEGEVRLPGAHISGQLTLNGAKLANPNGAKLPNPNGCALYADRITVGGGMYCGEGFQAEGEVRLTGAHISGQLVFRGASLHEVFALDFLEAELTLDSLQAESLWLNDMAAIGRVNLDSAQVKVLDDTPGRWPPSMRLDGFIYESLQPYAEARGASGRLAWLAHLVPGYRAQPYEQLAAYYRRLGHDEEARRVLLAKQRRRRHTLGPVGRLTGYLLDGIVGYGYRPSRAFTWLVVLLAAGSVYFTVNRPAPINPAQHPHYQPVLYTADLLIPLVNLGQSNLWAPRGAAQWVAAALVGLGWVLVTAVVAGITRVLARA